MFTMVKKGDAYESLSLLFQQDGASPNIIVDNLKEQTLGNFKRKIVEAGYNLRHT